MLPVGVTQIHLSHTFPIVWVCSYKILFICHFNPGKECFSGQSIFWIINRCCWYNVLKVTQRVVVRKKFSCPWPQLPIFSCQWQILWLNSSNIISKTFYATANMCQFSFYLKKIINSSTWYTFSILYIILYIVSYHSRLFFLKVSHCEYAFAYSVRPLLIDI